MKGKQDFLSYEARWQRVIDWMFDHLDEDPDLNRLADIACLSPFHWHRIYQAMRGETIIATLRRLRLHRAAVALLQSSKPIAEVARDCGYGNLQAFTRLFKASYGLSPARYRREGSHRRFDPISSEETKLMHEIKIKYWPRTHAVTVDHRGPYMEINRAFEHLFGTLAARDQLPVGARMIGIFYDDVTRVPADQLRSRAGILLETPLEVASPLQMTEIAGGEYAMLRHRGPYADMKAAYDWLYGSWLPRSGREPADAPGLELYLNTPEDTAPPDLLSDLCLPLKPLKQGTRS